MDVIISPVARRDIERILARSEEQFGSQAMTRYKKLIATAIEQVTQNPERASNSARPEITRGCRTYHLSLSRKSAARPGQRVGHPRHLLLYRVIDMNVVEIGRVLHDSMELSDHLPEAYRPLSD